MARDLGASVDYFHIKINGAIAGVGAQADLENCFNATGGNPGYSADNFYCQQITRDPTTGYVALAKQFSENIGAFVTDGVDVEGHWGFALHDLGLPERAGGIMLQSYSPTCARSPSRGCRAFRLLDFAGAIGDTRTAFAWTARASRTCPTRSGRRTPLLVTPWDRCRLLCTGGISTPSRTS